MRRHASVILMHLFKLSTLYAIVIQRYSAISRPMQSWNLFFNCSLEVNAFCSFN